MSKTKLTQADITLLQDELGKGVRLFKAFEKGEEALATLAGLGQYEGELKQRIADIEEKKKSDEAYLEDVGKRAGDIEQQTQDKLHNAKLEADRLVDEAKGEAEAIIAKAGTDAQANVDEVKRLEGVIADRTNELADLDAKIADAQATIDSIRAKAQAL